MNKKLIAGTLIGLSLTGCSNVKTYESINTPYEIVNEELAEYKVEGLNEYTDRQSLKNVKVRELTEKENNMFIEKVDNLTTNNFNNDYKVIEFDFGDFTRIYTNKKSFEKFNDEKSYFVFDDEVVKKEFYQISSYKEEIKLYQEKEKTLTGKDNKVVYGKTFRDFKILVLIEKDILKKGLQFRTEINNEVIYIDIE